MVTDSATGVEMSFMDRSKGRREMAGWGDAEVSLIYQDDRNPTYAISTFRAGSRAGHP
jgi:hypothetical protein